MMYDLSSLRRLFALIGWQSVYHSAMCLPYKTIRTVPACETSFVTRSVTLIRFTMQMLETYIIMFQFQEHV